MNIEAEKHREAAREAEQRREESFQRSDTDGFLSQWASGLTAQEHRLAVEILEHGGTAEFVGLWRMPQRERVAAKMIPTQFGDCWLIRQDHRCYTGGRKFVPIGRRSRVQRDFGLVQMFERAPARATLQGRGKGLSGTAWVAAVRTGCPWGTDATVARDLPEDW